MDRPTLLKIVAGACVGLYLLNLLVIDPATQAWAEQSERIAALKAKVEKGRALLEREDRLRGLWAAMMRANLPEEHSAAEAAAFTALSRWQGSSGISVTSLTPQWQAHDDEGYEEFEFRAAATGDLGSVGKFLYALGTDAMPCNLEECEISTRDPRGQTLNLTARFSFVRVSPDLQAGRSGGSGGSGRAANRGGNGDE